MNSAAHITRKGLYKPFAPIGRRKIVNVNVGGWNVSGGFAARARSARQTSASRSRDEQKIFGRLIGRRFTEKFRGLLILRCGGTGKFYIGGCIYSGGGCRISRDIHAAERDDGFRRGCKLSRARDV